MRHARHPRQLAFVLVGVVPALLLATGVARFTLHHFFYRAPFLFDSGWLSAVVYRAGLVPANPDIAFGVAHDFFAVHFSPILSAFSAASYVQPLPRIEWYALFEAVMYLPIGLAVFAATNARTARTLLAATAAALAFVSSGLVLVFVASSHFEPAIPGLLCLTLAALVAGRTRLAWVLLALTFSIREDAGVHAACALAPLAYLAWRDRSLWVETTTLVRMIVASLAWTVAAIVIQRLFFGDAESTLRRVYLGSPLFAHLDAATLLARARYILTDRQFFTFPLLATVVLAVVRRDGGYLLGWAATLPWFLLNFLANDTQKGAFNGYTAFPFVTAMFWVLVYGGHLARQERRPRPAALYIVFAAICLSSTLGLAVGDRAMVPFNLKEMYFHRDAHPDAVHAFADLIGHHRDDLGHFRVDEAVASVAIEHLHAPNAWLPGMREIDTLAFHRDSWSRTDLIADVLANQLDHCTLFLGTRFVICARTPLPASILSGIETRPIPSVFAFNPRKRTGSFLGVLAAGTYTLTITVAYPAEAIVRSGSSALGRATITGPGDLVIPFKADGTRPVLFDVSGPGSLAIAGAALRTR
jgi:hypothetical protein